MKNNSEINLYSRDEIIELLKLKDRLVFVDTGVEEVIAKYEDIPDIIVDFYNKFQFPDLTIYDFENEEKLITTFGPFLNKCKPEVREDIIENDNPDADIRIVDSMSFSMMIGHGAVEAAVRGVQGYRQ